MEPKQLVTLTADIVAAHVSNNRVEIDAVGSLIQRAYDALSNLGQESLAPEAREPAVSVKASVKRDYLTCLECGERKKTLKLHLQSAHRMTPSEYRAEFGLPDSYPMVAPAYAERRSELAKSIGLGSASPKLPRKKPAATRGRR